MYCTYKVLTELEVLPERNQCWKSNVFSPLEIKVCAV